MSPVEIPFIEMFRLGSPLLEKIKEFVRHGALFGAGGRVILPPPPQRTPQVGPDGQGPAQEEIDKVNAALTEVKKQLDELHKAGEKAAEAAGENSDTGRLEEGRILSGVSQLDPGIAAQGSVPEADAGRLEAIQQQVDELAKNVQNKADAANGIADGLRNMGAGMPGLGMPSLGGAPGLGMPGGGLSPLGGSGLGAPAPVDLAGNDPLKPAPVSSPGDGTLTPPPIQDTNAPLTAPVASTGATGAPAGNLSPGAAAATPADAKPKAADTPATKDITLPGGQVVTARSAEAAQAVRNALESPTGTGDMASAAYAGTGVDIPTDGADPGRKVDPADVKPGDIAICDDHTAIVAGNGQLIGPDGQLQPLGVINDWQGFKGFFDPTAAADADSTTTVPPTAPSAPPNGTGTASDTTVLAAGPTRAPGTPSSGTIQAPVSPGFGLPATPQHDR